MENLLTAGMVFFLTLLVVGAILFAVANTTDKPE